MPSVLSVVQSFMPSKFDPEEIRRKAETVLPTSKAGTFKMIVYADNLESELFVALVKGEIPAKRSG